MARFLHILAVFAAGLSACLALEVSLTGSKSEAREGENMTITCHITNYVTGTVIEWRKVSERETVAFGENHVINAEYATDEKRYRLDLVKLENSGEYNMVLTIATVKLEDAGTFEVLTRDEARTTDRFNLTVIVDPEPLTLTFNGAVINGGEEFEMEENSVHDIRCDMKGIAPLAEPVIMAGEFHVSEGDMAHGYSTETMQDSEEGDFVGFYKIKYDSILSGEQVKFDARYANKEVRCEVKGRPDLRSPAFKTKFPGMSPVWSLHCTPSFVTYNGAHNVKVGCAVTALPPADVSIEWHYRNPQAHGGFKLAADTAVEDRPPHYSMAVEEVDEATKNVTLQISVVKPQMFRPYTFVATNDLGSSNITITLERDVTLEVSTNMATRSCPVSSALLLLSAIYFLFH